MVKLKRDLHYLQFLYHQKIMNHHQTFVKYIHQPMKDNSKVVSSLVPNSKEDNNQVNNLLDSNNQANNLVLNNKVDNSPVPNSKEDSNLVLNNLVDSNQAVKEDNSKVANNHLYNNQLYNLLHNKKPLLQKLIMTFVVFYNIIV